MPEKIQFYPIDSTYKIVDGNPRILLFGRTADKKQVCIIDQNFKPYLYVLLKDESDIETFCEKVIKVTVEHDKRDAKVTNTETIEKNYLGKRKRAIKVFTQLPADVPVIREVIKSWDMVESCHEYDIPFTRRYFIDKKITPLTLVEAEGEFIKIKSRVPCFDADSIAQVSTESFEEPKILAFDIETYNPSGRGFKPDTNPILMVAFSSKNFKKVITWKRFKTDKDYIEFVSGEAELIEKFKDIIESQKPDILTGYFSDKFDFPYIISRAKKYKIDIDINLDYSVVSQKRGKSDSVSLTGIVHVDAYNFIYHLIRRSLETASYSLNAVSKELLGEQKEDVDIENLAKAWDNDIEKLEEFCSYNLQDAVLTHDLCIKILPNITELVKIVGLPIKDISSMGFSQLVEWYILKQVQEFNEIAPNKPSYNQISERRAHTYTGAFVYEPKPGLYKGIAVFDFRSLYPTIIASHNICLSTLHKTAVADAKLAPVENEKYYFSQNKKGFLPLIIEELISRRSRLKEILKTKKEPLLQARSENLKLLANAFYGYLGFYAARWYSLECARSVTAYGRFHITNVIDEAKKAGFEVIYGDSLPYDRNIFVEFDNGEIKLIKIGELYDKYRYVKGISTISFNKDKKVAFNPILRVIRHKYHGKLLKIITRYGSTIVTPQHSIYSFNNGVRLTDAAKLRKGDKLISVAAPEIKVKYNEGHVFDLTKLDMGNYKEKLMLYRDNLVFPQKTGTCPYCQKKVILSRHIHSRHYDRRQKFENKSRFKWVGGENSKIRNIPRYWKLDKDLAWLLGFYCAEGSVSDVKIKIGKKYLLSLGSQDKSIIKKVKRILDTKTKIPTEIITNYDRRIGKNMFYYRVQCMPIVALFQFGFCAGKGSELKKVPWFIFNADESLRKAFIKGYLDGDGNNSKDKRYKTHFMEFCTKSKELAEGLEFVLKTLFHGKNYWGKEIKHVAWKYRKDKPKINSLRLQSAKESKGNFCLAEIRSIEEIPSEEYVYDVEVKGAHNFVDAEGMLLVHNTDSIFLSLKEKTKEDAFKFGEKINAKLPGLMELDYEGTFPAGIFVSAKAGEYGAKKKYALIDEKGKLKIKGFETVRRNWSFIAKEVQENVLNIILKENDLKKAVKYVNTVIQELKDRKIPNEKVMIHTQLQKSTQDYAAVSPHVAVARKMKAKGIDVSPGTVIKFIITAGKGILRDRAKIPDEIEEGEYDADYYINSQIIPSVERIFAALGYKKEDLVSDKKQSSLGAYF